VYVQYKDHMFRTAENLTLFLQFRHAFTGWPGSTHDARVLRQSSLYDIGENSNKIGPNKYLIVDSAYPLFEKFDIVFTIHTCR
jgi:hypothetical protein